MNRLPPNTPESLPNLQHTVQRKFGRCLLRLQQYEGLLKVLVAHSDIAGAPSELQSAQDAQVVGTKTKTLGTLVGRLTGSYLASGHVDEEATEDEAAGDGPWLRFRYQLKFSPEQYKAAKAALKELVDLRNELVHHFLERFDIWKAEGCLAADAYLNTSYETIDDHFLTLCEWAQALEESRKLMASIMSTSAFEDVLVNGICPDGTIIWPMSGAVACLREAEPQCEEGGWTKLNSATAWIHSQYPEQQPERYGCRSWRQVIYESGQFEVRKQSNPDTGCREVWYRSRQETTVPSS